MRRFILSLAILAATCACRADTKTDIEYGQAGGVPLLLNAHVPDGSGPFPIAILVHGGGWMSGDKSGSNHPGDGADVSPWFDLLTPAHFTWFSINYRMAPKYRWPACLDDLDTAIRWVKAHAAEYKGDPSRIVLFGHSAGGHLVMYAATQPNLGVRAVVGFAPVTDLVSDSERRGGLSTSLQNLFGRGKEITAESRAVLADASPLDHVHPGMPPILILHGDADRTVPIGQSIAFVAKVNAAGGSAELMTRHGLPHSLVVGERLDPSYRPALLQWLSRELDVKLPPAPAISPWLPDRGDGTYRNPVLFADYSDPDVVRVGEDFWLTSSSFNHAPGLPILHSRDLVNWTLVNHALPQLVPVDHFAQARHGAGVWAPAIRYHDGRYYIYYPDPDFGIYVVTTKDPTGKWSAPVLVCGGKGLIDPCPFWDQDGQAYLVHGWARSRAGIANRLTLRRLSADGMKTLDDGVVIIDGDTMPGWHTIEGPKLYRRGEYYYVFAPAGGVTEGYQAVFRARNIYGPYENRIVLAQGRTAVNGPHQGAWVDTAAGEDWFIHFQDRGAFGRVVHLQPMSWGADGWPRMGTAAGTETEKGEPVLTHAKPRVAPQPILAPATSDEFETDVLGLQWQWQANASPEWYSLTARPGVLRLTAMPAGQRDSLWNAPYLLLQKFPAPRFVVTTQVELEPSTVGDEAGLVVFGYDYAWIGLRRATGGSAPAFNLVQAVCRKANEGGREADVVNEIHASGTAPVRVVVQLRVSVAEDGTCQFSYAGNGRDFVPVGKPFHATQGRWIGAKVGVFAQTGVPSATPAHADFDWFRISAP